MGDGSGQVVSTKRGLLLFVCEHSGAVWVDGAKGEEIAQWLAELVEGQWIMEMLGGFEPTAKALDKYPEFRGHADLEDGTREAPTRTVDAEQADADKLLEKLRTRPTAEVTERVALLLLILLSRHLTLNEGYSVVIEASRKELLRDSPEGRLVLEWAALLLG